MFDELDFYNEFGGEASEATDPEAQDTSKAWIKESKLFLVSDLDHLTDIFARIPDNAEVAHDTETTSLDIQKAKLVGISMAYEDPLDGLQGFYIPVGHTINAQLNLPLDKTLEAVINLGKRVKYIFYNAKYDCGIYKYHGVSFPNKEDAMVSVFCYDTGYKALGLKMSSKRFFNQSMIEITDLFERQEEERLLAAHAVRLEEYKSSLQQYHLAMKEYEEAKANKVKAKKPVKKDFGCEREPSLEKVKISKKELDFSALCPKDSYLYAASDALQTLKIHRLLAPVRVTEKEANEQFPLVKAAGQSFIYKVENKLIDALLDMECNKVRIDVDYIKRLTPQVIDDLFSTMSEVYKDLKIPIDFGNRADFFYRVTELPVKVKVDVTEFPITPKGTKRVTCSINGNPCILDVHNEFDLGEYTASYSEGLLQNVRVKLQKVPLLTEDLASFDAELVYPEKTEFFIDSPIKIGHLLFTPKEFDIDFYTGIPIESYSTEVNIGFADQVKTQMITVTGLKERLGDKYNEDDVLRLKGFGIKGGRVTEKAGQWRTDDETLTPLAKQSKAIEVILSYRKKKKNLSTYVLPFYNLKQDEDGNYYAKFAFRSMAAPSGRLAAGDKEGAGYIGVNAQAVPSNYASIWLDAKRVISR